LLRIWQIAGTQKENFPRVNWEDSSSTQFIDVLKAHTLLLLVASIRAIHLLLPGSKKITPALKRVFRREKNKHTPATVL